MSFLNLILLGGAAAAGIPLLIHLLHRSRFKIVPWAAMHLLDPRHRAQKRRIQLENLLLLLVRCAIPVVLALLMARPVLRGMATLLGTAKTSTVILLDNSYSMEVGVSNRTTFAQAREAASQIIRNLSRGSEVAVVLMGGVPGPLLDEPTFNTDRADRQLAKLPTGYGSAATPTALEMAVGELGKMHEAHRELIVISDFQKVSWTDDQETERTRLANSLAQLPVTPRVTFLHVGREDKNNVSVQSLDFSRFLLGVGQPFQVRANLKNYGATTFPNLRVYFRVDGQERSASQVTLEPGEAGQVLFTHTFETPGSHMIAVEADVPDVLKADNSLLASVPVWDHLPVLLVNGSPGHDPLDGETDFLELALHPTPADLITPTVITPNQLDAKQLKDQRVVVLANVPQLDARQLATLEDFVRGGGGLLIFPGSQIKTEWYNAKFAGEGNGLFPGRLTALEGGLADDAPHSAILVRHFDHPALAIFNDPRQGNLAAATIRLWYKFAEKTDSTFVLARLNTGDPFLIEKKFDAGSVIACSVPCAAEWSNLPLRPFYLPLMQRLVTYLAAKFEPSRNVDIGRPLTALLPSALIGKALELTDPAGQRHKLIATNQAGRAVVQFTDTHRPGLYLLDTPTNGPVHFVVNTTRAESDLTQLTAEEIKTVAKPWEAKIVSSWDEYRELQQRRRFGRELWRPLLGVLLGLIFTELALAQRLGGVKR